jgi:hypothetical protein
MLFSIMLTKVVKKGRTPDQTEQLQQAHERTIHQTMCLRFLLHFTPVFSKIKPSKNYSVALKHWVESVIANLSIPVLLLSKMLDAA